MKIKISNLPEGKHSYDFKGNIADIGLTEPFTGNYELKVKLEKQSRHILLNAGLTTTSALLCDRCTKEYSYTGESDFTITYLYDTDYFEGEELDANVKHIPFEEDEIDISEEVYDFAQLSIPMRKLCNEDCKGLCHRCGADLNIAPCECKDDSIDDRWLPLLEIKKKLNL